MTTTAEKIKVMQAFENGECIQQKFKSESDICWRGDWCKSSDSEPNWDWQALDYRVKPKPREIWVNEYEDGRHLAYNTKLDARDFVREDDVIRKSVKYREVSDDES